MLPPRRLSLLLSAPPAAETGSVQSDRLLLMPQPLPSWNLPRGAERGSSARHPGEAAQWVIHYVFQNGVRGIHTKSTDPEFLGNEIQKFENKKYCSLCSIRNLFLDSNHFHKPGYSLLLTSFLYFLSYSPLLALSLIRKQCPNDKHNYNGMYRI